MTAPASTADVEEIFDVVDLDDRVVDAKPRTLVHREKLMHRAIHVFVFNSGGEVFLQRRSLTKDSAPGKWVSSCSGHVDRGEDYDCAASRELAEELGLAGPGDLSPVFKEPACPQTGHEFVWVYRCRSEGPFDLDPGEISEGRWIQVEALNAWLEERPRDFAWSFAHLWPKFLKLAEG